MQNPVATAYSRRSVGRLAATALVGLAASTGAMAQAEKPIVKMATSPVGSAGYAIATAMAKVVGDKSPYKVELAGLTGSGAIADLLTRGEIAFGFMTSIDQVMAYNGQPPYKTSYRELRLMTLGSPWRTSIVVRKDSPYKKIADLKGRRVSGAYTAHPVCAQIFLAVLANAGMTPRDVTIVPVPHAAQGVQALIEGRVDAAGCSIPQMGLMKEADAKFGVRYLPIDVSPAALERTQKIVAVLQPEDVKGGSLTGIVGNTEMLTYAGAVAASTKTSDKAVFDFLKAMWDNGDDLRKLHNVFKEWGHKEMPGSGAHAVPFHNGAVQFYKSVGVWTPTHERKQAALTQK
jgi:TRAP transporter TAXI family solute receptor